MTLRQSNLAIFIIFGCFIIYRLIFPAALNDTISNTLLIIAIEIFASILLFILLQLLQNSKHLWFYIQTQILYRKKEIRLSISYLFKIKVDGHYLLVKNRTRNYFQPVGGAFKTLPGSEKLFEKLNVTPDRLIETEKGIAKNDLRICVQGRNVISFLDWFNSKQDRELSPWREFCEELITTKILPWQPFRYIDYKFKKTVKTPIITLDSGEKGMFIYEIYDLILNDEQKPLLQELLQKGDTDKYVWASEYLMKRLGHDEQEKRYKYEIGQHSQWII